MPNGDALSPNPLIVSERNQNKSCTPTCQLQNSFRDQSLIRKGQRVKSCQSRVQETEKWSLYLEISKC